jgi:hypothetical protein
LDEFPSELHEPGLEPESRHGLVIAIVVVGIVISLAALYFYGFSRGGQAPDETRALAPAPSDTEVAVEPGEPAAPGGAAASADGDGPREVVRPPEVVQTDAESVAPAGTGQLVIRSTPSGALVTVDGERAGLTPVTVTGLSYGRHDVQVARPGYVPVAEQVELTEASASRTLAISLSAGAEAPAAAPAVGALDVDSRPRGATVRVDGRQVGVTPLRLPSLAIGTHVVELDLAGYRLVRAEVAVERGRPSRLAVTLEPGGS